MSVTAKSLDRAESGLSRADLLHIVLSPGVERNGAGGVFTFYGEAVNGGAGGTVYALPLILRFGDLGCSGSPP